MSTKLSEHFTLEELIFSVTAARENIDNLPLPDQVNHAKLYLVPGLEQIRTLLGKPLHINSGYRSIALNAATPGSSNTSQHTKFEAADITSPEFGDPISIAKAIIASNIIFDQLIYEYTSWVHISFSEKPRKIIMTKRTGKPYEPGIVLASGRRIL